jgi:predicted O-linked N-acetylglucosamine transferase (SPINDLY family)
LDTRIVNGIITTSDALRAGVPVITLQGNSFTSRVSSSILTAIELPELIAQSLEEYESLAIDLVHNSGKLHMIREKIAKNRLVEPLFDTPRFTRSLEKAYKEMREIFVAGGRPRQIDVVEC